MVLASGVARLEVMEGQTQLTCIPAKRSTMLITIQKANDPVVG